jgi:hypothetical protein
MSFPKDHVGSDQTIHFTKENETNSDSRTEMVAITMKLSLITIKVGMEDFDF